VPEPSRTLRIKMPESNSDIPLVRLTRSKNATPSSDVCEVVNLAAQANRKRACNHDFIIVYFKLILLEEVLVFCFDQL
jgi:hypothetical protein